MIVQSALRKVARPSRPRNHAQDARATIALMQYSPLRISTVLDEHISIYVLKES